MNSAPFQILSASVSDRGLSEKRPQNEDSFLELPAAGLFVVADGVGGAQAGEVASQTAVEVLSEAFRNVRGKVDVEDLMEIAIQRANSAIFRMSQDVSKLNSMATTIVALQISGNVATIGHVGDSRLYRLDARGNLHRETADHSVVEEEVRAGRLTPEQAANHPSRNVISRALGADDAVEVDMKTLTFEPGTVFLLCSDGITRHVPDAELRDILTRLRSPHKVCAHLRETCFARGAEDNLTAVVIKAETVADAAFDDDEDDTGELTISSIRQPAEPVPAVTNDGAVYRMDGIAVSAPAAAPPPPAPQKVKTAEAAPASRRGSFVGRMFRSLLLLIVGAAAGFGGYYWYTKNAPVVTDTAVAVPAPSSPYAAFENDRRSADRNSAEYIKTHADKVSNAEDNYLLARAYVHQKRYTDALASLQRARETLSMTSEENRETLKIEIAALAVVAQNKEAQAIYEKDQAGTPTMSTGNTNSDSRIR